jgi:hypothetical protein
VSTFFDKLTASLEYLTNNPAKKTITELKLINIRKLAANVIEKAAVKSFLDLSCIFIKRNAPHMIKIKTIPDLVPMASMTASVIIVNIPLVLNDLSIVKAITHHEATYRKTI